MTDRYAVIGHPISHSKSPLIHRLFAEQTGQDISYEAIEAPLDGFAATIDRLRDEGYKGCNVTVPFKFEAFRYVAQLHGRWNDRVNTATAANTLKLDEVSAENTDGLGLVCDIQRNHGISLKGKRVLLMGAGGASYGVALPLLEAGAVLTVANRTAEKAEKMAASLSFASEGTISGGGYETLAGQQFDIVINATSSGLFDELPPLPAGIFAPGALAYDMMYGRETPFMRFAREQGAAVVADGLGMLVEQAAEAFFIWRGVRPDTAPVLARLRQG